MISPDALRATLMDDGLLVAIVGVLGIGLGALIQSLANRRSVYVSTIAAERIKWVGELREDFVSYITTLEGVDYQFRQNADQEIRDSLLDLAATKRRFIHLKVNRRSSLDRQILSVVDHISWSAGGDEELFIYHCGLLSEMSADLLKEEWEKAKFESSGVGGRLRILVKAYFRRREYQKRREAHDLSKPSSEDVAKYKLSREHTRRGNDGAETLPSTPSSARA